MSSTTQNQGNLLILCGVVEQRLEVQTEYNDLLASKLEEALERISKLEEVAGKKK